MTVTRDQTIREIVATDYRTAAVFERHGVDFCCNGCRTVEEGCLDARADQASLLRDLDAVAGVPAPGQPQLASLDTPTLVSYIVDTHHRYVRQVVPELLRHTSRIAEVHGERHTELLHIARLFQRVAADMMEHMTKEERILFPFIVMAADAARAGRSLPASPFGTVQNPIHMMETEHRFVGDAMAEISALTGGYRPPDDACATYTLCLEELDAFERDLHVHVHAENNILFPRAVALEAGAGI